MDPGAQGIEPPRLIPFAHLLVHMRNRAYSPQMGRFMQPDPNATALTLIEAASYHGRGMDAMVAAFDMQGMYGDGMNLYEYLGSSPWGRSDPLGLSWDPFSMVDDFQAEHAASTAAFMSALGRSAAATAVIAATIASYLPFPFVGNLGELALYALGETSESDLAVAMALGLVPGGKLAAKFSGLGSFIGRIGSAAWSGAKALAQKHGGPFSRLGSGLFGRAKALLAKGCFCFEAQTEVWTVRGLVPIEEIEEGDLVIATDESTGQTALRAVKRTFIRHGAPIVAVTLLVGGLHAETFNTTEEHPFYVEGRGWVPAQDLCSGDIVRTLIGGFKSESEASSSGSVAEVGIVEFTSRRATVYNFEVEGVHTYRVGASGVLVHNTSKWCPMPGSFESVRDFIKQHKHPPKGFVGGSIYANDGRAGSAILPRIDKSGKLVTYKEYDIYPSPKNGGPPRTADRIVVGSDGIFWKTSDHYKSFSPMP